LLQPSGVGPYPTPYSASIAIIRSTSGVADMKALRRLLIRLNDEVIAAG
jgi:hypothetical protein